jgi:Rrf2 family iron-sulfur cluster assembly transcriptional regulator
MKITRLEENGIRLAVCLARGGGQMTLSALASEENLTEALVAKIMGKLRRGGVIRAVRGRAGGYELKDAPSSITVAAVVRALGRPVLDGCQSESRAGKGAICPHHSDCSLRPIWEHLAKEVTDTLDRITIEDLLKKERHIRARVRKLRVI